MNKKTLAKFMNLGHVLGRAEMKKIMAGCGEGCNCAVCYWCESEPTTYSPINCVGSPSTACEYWSGGGILCDATWGIC